jgi:hypothetical protein
MIQRKQIKSYIWTIIAILAQIIYFFDFVERLLEVIHASDENVFCAESNRS